MKLKNFRRVAALGMAVSMTAVLAACGNRRLLRGR